MTNLYMPHNLLKEEPSLSTVDTNVLRYITYTWSHDIHGHMTYADTQTPPGGLAPKHPQYCRRSSAQLTHQGTPSLPDMCT